MAPARIPFVAQVFAALVALSPAALAQHPAPHGPPVNAGERDYRAPDVVTRVPGTVTDLALGADGQVLYCSREGEVGWFDPGSSTRRVLAPAGSFPAELRAVAVTPAGAVTVIDEGGDIFRLPGDSLPYVQVYDDVYMIHDVTDMIIDASGNHLIASRTPSTGQRGTNRVSADGQRWDYYIVRHQPVALAADPVSGDVLLADEESADAIWMIDSHDNTWPTSLLQSGMGGISAFDDDGDIAVEADGDLYWIAGGEVWKRRRQGGAANLYRAGFGQLRGAAIAPSSGLRTSYTGWSLYLAEGSNPTRIHELAGVGAPADPIATNQGWVPARGTQKLFLAGIQAFEITKDNDDNLLVGGSLYGNNAQVRRVDIVANTMTVVADANDGLTGTIEGITVAADDTIYASNRDGTIFRITENPLDVTTVYTDPGALVTAGKDLALDINGAHYIADRDYWGGGDVIEVNGSTASILVAAAEARGLSADPSTGGMFVTEWNCAGFCGSVALYDFGDDTLTTQPGFVDINYTNDSVWGDGDTVVDIHGNIYTVSEDDWSVVKYSPDRDGIVRIGSGYLNHPTGIALARSSPGLNSPSGWSLYISEYDFLWERPGFPPPAAARVDSQTSIQGLVVGVAHPRFGQPRDLAQIPNVGVFLTTSDATVLQLDVTAGEATPVATAADGLSGDLVGIDARSDGTLVIANRAGDLFALDSRSGSVELLHRDQANILNDVRGLAVDGQDRVVLVDRAGSQGLLVGYDGSRFVHLAESPRGLRAAVDPLTGDFFVTVRGAGGAFGTLQRVRQRSLRSITARARPARPLAFGDEDGGISFDAAGNLILATGDAGRIVRVDRRTGRQTNLSGNHARPVATEVVGESLFVLDGWVVYEVDLRN